MRSSTLAQQEAAGKLFSEWASAKNLQTTELANICALIEAVCMVRRGAGKAYADYKKNVLADFKNLR